jgi:Fic family protein
VVAGRVVKIQWDGRTVETYIPAEVADFAPALSERIIRRTEQAIAAVLRTGDREAGGLEPAARMLLRSEGVASSNIEGVHADVADVVVAEVDDEVLGAAVAVADDLAAVSEALAHDGPLTADAFLGWHRRLMRHTDLAPEHVGAWRDRQGWVGGPNPLLAAFVAAPPDHVDRLMTDLVKFANRRDVDAITQAAVVHAQFETVHPFADGNGRIGRILVGWVLRRRLGIAVPPPVSVQFARDIGGYLSGLARWRQGDVDQWISWFAETVERSATSSDDLLSTVAQLRGDWRARVRDLRSDAAARRLVDHLIAHPVLNASVAAQLIGSSEQAARTALDALAKRDVLRERTIAPNQPARTGRPHRWFVAHELLALLGA